MYRPITNDDTRWSRLEDCSDASAVVSRRMEVLYLNPAARSLVPPRWRGLRCWEVFPVRDRSCASPCPAMSLPRSFTRLATSDGPVSSESVGGRRMSGCFGLRHGVCG